jgi:Mrp family chromosome partitioning ATPase
MSALDQALTKAYAKNRTPVTASPVAMPAKDSRQAPQAPRAAAANAVERIYHDGSLYRVESPAAGKRAAGGPPPAHLATLPPTSPRRSVRRSLLRMLAAQPATLPAEPVEAPPRVARKVIIRHVSHSAAPPPLGLLRSTPPAPPVPRAPQIELPPEALPEASPVEPTPEAAKPAKPQPAPSNLDSTPIGPIDVCGDWSHEGAVAPQVLIANTDKSETPWAVVSVELDALAVIETAVREQAARESAEQAARLLAETAASSFAAKSLEDTEEPRPRFRLDSAHASSFPTPHAKFEIPAAEELELPEIAPLEPVAETIEELTLDDAATIESDLPDLTFAESAAEALASDLIPAEPLAKQPVEEILPAPESVAEVKPASPLWEVDQFHWPRTCEKLFADDQGYLARAGDKLLAAVQDGLRVLAITGTRRGEGRTTLALCLARAAARAGVQVAVMDTDFARPQLASKIALDVAYGWQDAALGKIPLSEAAIKSLQDRVTVLPLESAAVTRGLSLADPRVTATIRAAAATFELLILDMGPTSTSEQLTFPKGEACPFDAAIVVRDLRFATATESQTLGETLQDAGVEAVGIAENFVIEDEIPATSV